MCTYVSIPLNTLTELCGFAKEATRVLRLIAHLLGTCNLDDSVFLVVLQRNATDAGNAMHNLHSTLHYKALQYKTT